jgi:N-acetyltransferase
MQDSMLNNDTLRTELSDERILIRPITQDDFEELYFSASDPRIWEQHPDKERYKREVFQKFFDGAMAVEAGFVVLDKLSGNIIGSSRYYPLNENERKRYSTDDNTLETAICIGYTFLAVAYWGGMYNSSLKMLMLNHAFRWYDTVIFQVGANNKRSRIAVERLGATLLPVIDDLPSHSQTIDSHVVYALTKEQWMTKGRK